MHIVFLYFFFVFIFGVCSCQDRISAVVNIAIDLISYLINLCASFGWQTKHTIYCVKFIRLNQRAVVEHFKSIRLVEHIKSIGIDVAKNGIFFYFSILFFLCCYYGRVTHLSYEIILIQKCFRFLFFASSSSLAQFKLYPIVQMIRRKSYFDDNDCMNDNVCKNAISYQSTNNDNCTNDTNNNSSSSSNNKTTQKDDDADEIDNVSLEILWEPKNGTHITADVVFIHGLHGTYQCACSMRVCL